MIKDNISWEFCNSPEMHCFIAPAVSCKSTWVNSLRIYYVLNDTLSIRVGNRYCILETDQLILINPYEMFSITKDGGNLAVFDFCINNMQYSFMDPSSLWFDCNSATNNNAQAVDLLKQFLARLVKFNENPDLDNELLNKSFFYAIMQHLISFFRAKKSSGVEIRPKQGDRMEKIIKYIDENYASDLSLAQLSSALYLSVPYTSKAFKQYFGQTFSEYVTNVRLEKSIFDLFNPNYRIEDVAEKNGFPNTRSYIFYFKKKYNKTPHQYRKNAKEKTKGSLSMNAAEDGMLVKKNDLSSLSKHLEGSIAHIPSGVSDTLKLVDLPACDVSKRGTRLNHSFLNMISTGKASDILSSDCQNNLREIQREIGFKYIRFHGLLDDDMMIYKNLYKEGPTFVFNYLDTVFDFLLSIDLKPILEFSYMPEDLSSSKKHLVGFSNSIISFPKDMELWKLLVSKIMMHLNERYGRAEVETWPVAVWNLPDTMDFAFGLGGLKPYYELYRETYFTVKKHNPASRFFSPSASSEALLSGDWLEKFFALCKKDNCLPDYIQYHFYPIAVDSSFTNPEKYYWKNSSKNLLHYKYDENLMKKSIRDIKKKFSSYIEDNNFYISEWNSTLSHIELLTDTCFQSAYIAKNILENYDSVKSICYWTLSDLVNKGLASNLPFHGGLGLFTGKGIKKASYYALWLLSKLGGYKLQSGDGYFITKDEDSFQIVLYNYHHYSALYANGELFDMTPTNRYTPFPTMETKRFSITLESAEESNYSVSEFSLNRKNGSGYDKWVELGAPEYISDLGAEYLKSVCIPQVREYVTRAGEGRINLTCTLEAHEVRLLIIKKKYE